LSLISPKTIPNILGRGFFDWILMQESSVAESKIITYHCQLTLKIANSQKAVQKRVANKKASVDKKNKLLQHVQQV